MATRIGPLSRYGRNLGKEAVEFGKAWKQAFDASADIMPGADARAAKANARQAEAQGQLIGALFGRAYDKKGRRIK
jgi:hypothetical protein